MPDLKPSETNVEYAIVGALTDDSVYGQAPGYQVTPILAWLDAHGWELVRKA